MSEPYRYILGLGSNLENPLVQLRRAVSALRTDASLKSQGKFFKVTALAPLYRSDAMLPQKSSTQNSQDSLNLAEQDFLGWNQKFLNTAVEVQTDWSPLQLLGLLKKLEKKLGRADAPRWAPRIIDIDLLVSSKNTPVLDANPQLQLPHIGLLERPFALYPAVYLWPEYIIQEKNLRQWARQWNENPPFGTQKATQTLSAWMGILNFTPDSFSDGGIHQNQQKLNDLITSWVQAGVEVIDVGAESTRPGAQSINDSQEIKRLSIHLDVLLKHPLRKQFKVSLDTKNVQTALFGLKKGVDWINDVTGFDDPQMIKCAAEARCPVVVMHHLGVPPSANKTIALDLDPIQFMIEWGLKKIDQLVESGIKMEQIYLDPGIGFGKTKLQNIELIMRVSELYQLGAKILVGHSRKSFLTTFTNVEAQQRDLETAGFSQFMVKNGIDVIRVHDPILNQRLSALSFV